MKFVGRGKPLRTAVGCFKPDGRAKRLGGGGCLTTVVSLPILMSSTLFSILCVVVGLFSGGWCKLPRDDADEEHKLWKLKKIRKRFKFKWSFVHLVNIFRIPGQSRCLCCGNCCWRHLCCCRTGNQRMDAHFQVCLWREVWRDLAKSRKCETLLLLNSRQKVKNSCQKLLLCFKSRSWAFFEFQDIIFKTSLSDYNWEATEQSLL